MNNSTRIYKCFLGSPSDTSEERDICDKVFREINNTLGEHLNFRIESKRWENDVFPDFGKDGQDVINQQIGGEFDIFVGIMWKKFGTPTARASSGTEEEFLNAYKMWEIDQSTNLMLYFNKQPVDIDNIDFEQLKKVKDFKSTVADKGGLYYEYNGSDDFEEKFKKHIQKVLLKKEECSKEDSSEKKNSEPEIGNSLLSLFNNRFEDALKTYSSQPIIWVDPILSKSDDIKSSPDEEDDRASVFDLCKTPLDLIIKAPPQFGLTCLSHFIIKTSLEKYSFVGLYLDAANFKANSTEKAVNAELSNLGVDLKCVKFIILDSWTHTETDNLRKLKRLSALYADIPLIVMQRIDENNFRKTGEDIVIEKQFDVLHLLPLPRGHVRQVVSEYNNKRSIGDEDVVLEKVVSDLEVLNIHRTPFNCITLLKVSEKYFDESPVNRTKMLEMVLFLLFNLDEVPTYKSKPDLKDCEYVLGRFCEQMIKENEFQFTRIDFIRDLRAFCTEKLIDLEIELVFDILFKNNIIIERGSGFVFRFKYWIFYFAAHRMHNNKDFSNYIFEEEKYNSFPEIIEFYTGIDRNRKDALEILIKDIRSACDVVERKVGLPENMNPYEIIKWKPSDESVSHIKQEIGDDVQQSKLPLEVKDRYADRNYDQSKPYNQTVHTVLRDYSLVVLMQKIKASSVALRNSDYVSPDVKRELLSEIVRSWDQLSKVLLALSPLLAQNGYAAFEGAGFILAGDWGSTFEQRINRVIQCNPTNVVSMFKDCLYSNKMGPLLFDYFKNEKNSLRKHELALFLVFERPNGWKSQIENYISTIHKNSFFLFDIFNSLRAQYRYSFASQKELSEMKYLIKMGLAKHEKGIVKPGIKAIKSISDRILPKRKDS